MKQKYYFLKELGYERWDDALDDYLKLNKSIAWDDFYEQRKNMKNSETSENPKTRKVQKFDFINKENQGTTEI